MPLHVTVKVALGGRGDELVVGDIVVPRREVPDEGFSGAADDDAVVGRALDEVVHESCVEAEGVGGGEKGSGGWVWGRSNAAGNAADGDNAGAELGKDRGGVRVCADDDFAGAEGAARRRHGVVAL